MESLYDLFNRKKEICALEERFTFEDPSIIIEDIIQESNLQLIQLRTDLYVNELLIEEAIYDDFDENYIHNLMETSFSEKKDKLIKFIQDKQAKLTAWFNKVIESIKLFIKKTKVSLKIKNGKHVDGVYVRDILEKCEKEVILPFADIDTLERADKKCMSILSQLFDLGDKYFDEKVPFDKAKSKALSIIGVKDQKEISKAIEKLHWGNIKPTKVKIKDLDHNILIVALEEDALLSDVQRSRDVIDRSYSNMLNELKTNPEYKNVDEKIDFLNYITNLQVSIISSIMNIIKKRAHDCLNIIKIALDD